MEEKYYRMEQGEFVSEFGLKAKVQFIETAKYDVDAHTLTYWRKQIPPQDWVLFIPLNDVQYFRAF